MNKTELVKARAHKAAAVFWHGIGGEAVSTFFGVDVGIWSAAVAAALIPGGSEIKDITRILGSATAGILGYKYTHKFYKDGLDTLATWHIDKALEHYLKVDEKETNNEDSNKEELVEEKAAE